MPEIDERVIVHKLSINPQAKLVKQKRRTIALEKQKVIEKKISRLLSMGFIFNIDYPKWLTTWCLSRSTMKSRECVWTTLI